MLIKLPPPWQRPEREVTPHHIYLNRRSFLQGLGVGGAATLLGCELGGLSVEGLPDTGRLGPVDAGGRALVDSSNPGRIPLDDSGQLADVDSLGAADASADAAGPRPIFPAPRNDRYTVPERALTDPLTPTRYNNYYEFTQQKELVWQLVGSFETRPWTLRVDGLCQKPATFDVDDLLRDFQQEERIYRFRCVEAWAMTVPWTGFPLADLLRAVEPLPEARYLRIISVNRPEQMPGMAATSYPWPYFEGLRIDEAMNELSLLATGLYGEPMPRQNGAPIRLITPWKYGYKSIKSIVHIELVAEQPPTFWNTLSPREYGFLSNVNPGVAHPRWSQASERLIPNGERVPTLLYNGYEEFVGQLYT